MFRYSVVRILNYLVAALSSLGSTSKDVFGLRTSTGSDNSYFATLRQNDFTSGSGVSLENAFA